MKLKIIIFSLFVLRVSSAVEIIAHRGFSGKYWENSLESIRQAWAVESDIVEVDLRLTHDGAIVLFHDDHISGKRVDELCYDELQALTPSFHIPTLQEAISATPLGKVLLLDLKGDAVPLAKTVTEETKKSPCIKFYFQSREVDALKYLQKNLDDPVVLFVSSLRYDFFRKAPDAKKMSEWIKQHGLSGISAKGRKFIDQDFVSTFQSEGLLFYVWTINPKDRLSYYRGLKVNGVITDFPNLMTAN
ncbi:glycerophosphodiester phosphodiesterase [Pontiellaceae bacterium B1224]|nr:glycerophosphodiester phosphodiesterase [Pontiellaceae bacterium B1224]